MVENRNENTENGRALIVGLGKSGIAAAEALKRLKADISVFDSHYSDAKASWAQKNKWHCSFGERPDSVENFDMVVLSPGVPVDTDFVREAERAGAEITGELELAYRFGKGKYIAITGTNGKTTTTTLVGEIFKNAGKKTEVVGNIGVAVMSKALDSDDDTYMVAECSSFQLETIHTFHPAVSAILNITPDHLNRHHTMECYIKTKERIAENQTEDEVCVLNYEDEVLRAFGETLHTNVLYFSSSQKLDRGLYLDGEDIYYADGENTTKVINVNELNILGMHNYENVMAATGIALSLGVPMDKIVEVLKRFQAVEHRIEYVTEKRGVKFYNDSKGTNPDAAIKGICAMNRPTLLIGGGYDKGSSFDEWTKLFPGRVKHLVLIGVTAPKVRASAEKFGFTAISDCETFEEAVDLCREKAEDGDCVLLSPACASWGMFDNYEQRGDMFKEQVRGYLK